MRAVQWQLLRDPRSAKHARALLRLQLTDWKITGEVADTAELLLSELGTNSVRYARTPPGREIGRGPEKRLLKTKGAGDSPSCRPWQNAGDAQRYR